jgi:hypothetical protein
MPVGVFCVFKLHHEVLGHQGHEGLREAGVDHAVLVDLDEVEDRLVEEPFARIVGIEVRVLEASDEGEGLVEVRLDLFPLDFGVGQGRSSLCEIFGEAFLLLGVDPLSWTRGFG